MLRYGSFAKEFKKLTDDYMTNEQKQRLKEAEADQAQRLLDEEWSRVVEAVGKTLEHLKKTVGKSLMSDGTLLLSEQELALIESIEKMGHRPFHVHWAIEYLAEIKLLLGERQITIKGCEDEDQRRLLVDQHRKMKKMAGHIVFFKNQHSELFENADQVEQPPDWVPEAKEKAPDPQGKEDEGVPHPLWSALSALGFLGILAVGAVLLTAVAVGVLLLYLAITADGPNQEASATTAENSVEATAPASTTTAGEPAINTSQGLTSGEEGPVTDAEVAEGTLNRENGKAPINQPRAGDDKSSSTPKLTDEAASTAEETEQQPLPVDAQVTFRSRGSGTITCGRQVRRFTKQTIITIPADQLPLTCKVEMGVSRKNVRVNGSGEVTCNAAGKLVTCTKVEVP
jgi:hypothetical protein